MLDVYVNCKIKTERLLIRPYSLIDVPRLHEIANNPEVYRYIPDAEITLEDVAKLVEWSISCNQQNKPGHIKKFNLGILNNDNLIGWCGLGPSDIDSNLTEIYYAIGQQYWGNGFGSEAVTALTDYAFVNLGVNKITATVAPENIASVKILRKIGMTYKYTLDSVPDDCDKFFIGHDYFELTLEEYFNNIQ